MEFKVFADEMQKVTYEGGWISIQLDGRELNCFDQHKGFEHQEQKYYSLRNLVIVF